MFKISFSLVCLISIAFAAQSNACEYLLNLDSVVPMEDLQGLQSLKIQVGLPSNKSHSFFAYNATALSKQSVSKKGDALEIHGASLPVNINMDQIVEMQKLRGANKGLQINVFRQTNLAKQFLKDASHLFLNMGAGQMLLQETNYTPADGQGEHGFDPRDLKYDVSGKAHFVVSSERVALTFSVTEVSRCK